MEKFLDKYDVVEFKKGDLLSLKGFILKDNIWFNGEEVCKKLGITDHVQALKSSDITIGGNEMRKELSYKDNNNNDIDITIISEPAVYSLIFKSTKKEALIFRNWVYTEVLPSIRKNGGYIAADKDTSPKVLTARLLNSIREAANKTDVITNIDVADTLIEALSITLSGTTFGGNEDDNKHLGIVNYAAYKMFLDDNIVTHTMTMDSEIIDDRNKEIEKINKELDLIEKDTNIKKASDIKSNISRYVTSKLLNDGLNIRDIMDFMFFLRNKGVIMKSKMFDFRDIFIERKFVVKRVIDRFINNDKNVYILTYKGKLFIDNQYDEWKEAVEEGVTPWRKFLTEKDRKLIKR